MVKNLPANAGDARDAGWILKSARSSGEGNGNPLQYSCQEYSHGTKEPGRLQTMWLQRFKREWLNNNIRPFKYDLNQIPYNYAVEVRNRFKGLDLIECLKNYGKMFMTLYRRQDQDHPQERRNAKKQNGCLRRPYK